MTISSDSDVTPMQIMDALEAENIETRPIWKPMHLQPVFEEDMERIIKIVRKQFRQQ